MANFVICMPTGHTFDIEIGSLYENLDTVLPKDKCFIIKNSSDELFLLVGDGENALGDLPFVSEDEIIKVIKRKLFDYVPTLLKVPDGWEK